MEKQNIKKFFFSPSKRKTKDYFRRRDVTRRDSNWIRRLRPRSDVLLRRVRRVANPLSLSCLSCERTSPATTSASLGTAARARTSDPPNDDQVVVATAAVVVVDGRRGGGVDAGRQSTAWMPTRLL